MGVAAVVVINICLFNLKIDWRWIVLANAFLGFIVVEVEHVIQSLKK